jgi:hypothetical protein
MKRVVMGAYFATLEQAEKHVHEKNTMWSSKIGWYIVDCTIGFLVISEAQAKKCFPHLFADVLERRSSEGETMSTQYPYNVT